MLWKRRTRNEQLPFRREQQLERDIITHCDHMIMNNPYQKQYMLGNYDKTVKDKALVLPHSFDASLYDKEIGTEDTGKIRMVYIGHLDDIRSPHLLLNAVLELKKSSRTWLTVWTFLFTEICLQKRRYI